MGELAAAALVAAGEASEGFKHFSTFNERTDAMQKRLLVIGLVVIVGLGAYMFFFAGTPAFEPEIRTVAVTQGNIVETVGATGTLEAVTNVNVGSQVSGIIQDLYVDYNSIVRKGDVIMRLDPSLFQTQIEQGRANLVRAEADLEQARVNLADVQMQLRRNEDLAERQLISAIELEAAQVAVLSASAQVKSSEASLTQSRASLNQNEVNLEQSVIRAPIDGIVISRLVDVGQTVAASMQAPELFLIAADLAKMRVIVAVDESDVGRIRPDQRVTFTVDAYPGEEFEGTVSQVRLEPVLTQNVVTYSTVVDAPNPNLRLKPGMTATITLEIARRNNVLRVPNTALRFRPTPAVFASLNQSVPPSLEMRTSPARQRFSGAHGEEPGASDWSSNTRGGGADWSGNGRGGGAGWSGSAGQGARNPEQLQQMRERFAQMTPEERETFRAQRRAAGSGGPRGPRGRTSGPPRPTGAETDLNLATVDRGATTIDALFGPLPVMESTGRVWILNGGRLEEIPVRLGVTDGTATELLGTPGTESSSAQPMENLNPHIRRLREQLTAIQDEQARNLLEQTIAQIEAQNTQTSSPSPITQMAVSSGTQLVVGVSTPEEAPQRGGSPLIPTFGRRRR